MSSLKDKLEEILHRRIDLRGDKLDPHGNPHRPELSVWATCDDETEPDGNNVVLMLASLWGQPQRCVEMNPAEARQLARSLIQVADSVEHICNGATTRGELMQKLGNSVALCDAERAP